MSLKHDKIIEAITFLLERKKLIKEFDDECTERSQKYIKIVEELRSVRLENKQLKLEIAKLKKTKR